MVLFIAGFFLLILFYSGAYIFVKKYIKPAGNFILLFINLALIFILYVFSLFGKFETAVLILSLSGALFFFAYLLHHYKQIWADAVQIISEWVKKFKLFIRQESVLKIITLIFICVASAFAILNLAINIWVHSWWLIGAIILMLAVFLFLVYAYLSIHFFQHVRSKPTVRIIAIVFFLFSIALFILFLTDTRYLAPRTDTIILQASESIQPNTSEVILLEVKESATLEKLAPISTGNWKNLMQTEGKEGFRAARTGDELIFVSQRKGPGEYQLLFMQSPSSGIIEIALNVESTEFNLKNAEVNQRIVNVSSNYSFLDLLVLASHLVFIITVVQAFLALIYFLEEYSHGHRLSKYLIFVTALLVFSVLFLIARPMTFWERDEFSHWGTYIREISIKDQLPVSDFCTSFPHYIPGITLFEYFFTRLLGFAEGHAYFAYLFFLLTMITPVFLGEKNKIFQRMLYVFSIVIALFLLPLKFISLYVDAPLGLLFGAGIIYIYSERESPFYYPGIGLIFCGLLLLKSWGIVFSMILAGIYLLNEFLVACKKHNSFKEFFSKTLTIFLILGVSIGLTQIIWQIHLRTNGIEDTSMSGGGLAEVLTIGSNPVLTERLRRWARITFFGRAGSGLAGLFSITGVCLLLFLAGLFLSKNHKASRRFTAIIFLFCLINLALLFLAYFVYFPEHEADQLASYERYASEYFAGWFLFVVYQLSVCQDRKLLKNKVCKTIHIVLFAITIICLPWVFELGHVPPKQLIGRREILQPVLDRYDDELFDSETYRIFHIAQNENDLGHHILRYEICPNTSQKNGWSFGHPYPEEIAEPGTRLYTAGDLEEIITSGYEYILITKPDQQFWDLYGNLFTEKRMQGDSLYKIENGQWVLID